MDHSTRNLDNGDEGNAASSHQSPSADRMVTEPTKARWSRFLSTKTILFSAILLGLAWFWYDPRPPRDIQVDLELRIDGRPIKISRVLHCDPHTGGPVFETSTEYYLSRENRVFGQRLPGGEAVIVWAPELCQAGLLKHVADRNPQDGPIHDNKAIRSDGRLAHIGWRPIPEGNLPLIGWLEDADNTDEILLYTSPQAYQNPHAHVQFVKMTVKNPDLNRPVDGPDEFWWLGTTDVVGRNHQDLSWDDYGYTGICLMPISDHNPEVAKLFWDKVDRKSLSVQHIRVHEPPVSGKHNVYIDSAFAMPSAYDLGRGNSLWGGWSYKKQDIDRRVIPSWVNCYPIRFDGKSLSVRMDMSGFIYSYPTEKISPFMIGKDANISLEDGTKIHDPFGDISVYYVQSLNQIFALSGFGFYRHKKPE